MPTLCKPAVEVPEHTISLEQTLEVCGNIHASHPQIDLALRLLRNTGVQKRHLVQSLELTLQHPGFEIRNSIYEKEAKLRVPSVIQTALKNADLGIKEIDAIIYVSCTGFMMPSMTAWLINHMGFRSDTKQIPIAQLGCAAGGAAINRAQDFCVAYPNANVLMVACEFCSLCYQPTDLEVGNLLANGLFGDAIGAAVVRGQGGFGVKLEKNASYLIPDSENWISYTVKSTGFHFNLDKRVPKTMKPLAPVLREMSEAHGWNVSDLDFYVIHAGGPRILNDLSVFLEIEPEKFRYSRSTLTEYGNVASVVVFDALRRAFEDGAIQHQSKGIIAGFGPGIIAEICLGTGA